MKSPVYRWKVSHPVYGSVEVTGPAEIRGRDLCREKVGRPLDADCPRVYL